MKLTNQQINDLLNNGYAILPQLVFGDINFNKESLELIDVKV